MKRKEDYILKEKGKERKVQKMKLNISKKSKKGTALSQDHRFPMENTSNNALMKEGNLQNNSKLSCSKSPKWLIKKENQK